MASALAHLLNFIFRRMPVIEDTAKERAQNASRRPPRPPKGVTVGSEAYGGIPCETVRKAGNGDTMVLYIHGGGFRHRNAMRRRGGIAEKGGGSGRALHLDRQARRGARLSRHHAAA